MLNFNIGDFIWRIILILKDFSNKLYEVLTTEISMEWLQNIFDFFDIGVDIGNLSLIGVLGTLSAGTLLFIIFYNIFKL